MIVETLQEQLEHPVLFHRVGWHGKDGMSQSIPNYDSRDPNVIAHQLECMKAVGGEDCGVIQLTFGPTVSPFIHESAMNTANQCRALGMPFALCFDPWTVKNPDGTFPSVDVANSRMIAALQHPDIQFILNMENYLPGKPVLDFSTNVDRSKVVAAVPGIGYWLEQLDYDWVQIPTVANKTKMPAVYVMFDDGTGPDRNKSRWDQKAPVRLVNQRGGKTYYACNVSGANNCNGKNYVQFETWDDYTEQTACEAWFSMVSGIRI